MHGTLTFAGSCLPVFPGGRSTPKRSASPTTMVSAPKRRPRADSRPIAPRCTADARVAKAVAQFHLMEERVSRVKCPFFRRRYSDALAAAQNVLIWLLARHKRLDLVSRAPQRVGGDKLLNKPITDLQEVIRQDFEVRSYYTTGRLTREIYADDCRFDGPDPDVPVIGLKKYIDAASHLFDRSASRVDLISIETIDEQHIRAAWRLDATLHLPWRPKVKPYVGETVYTIGSNGLVTNHDETWSISVIDAFISTLLLKSFGAPPAPPIDELRQ